MKKIFNKIKKWVFRPCSPKVKTRCILISLAFLLAYSIIISFFVHWLLALVPLFLLGLILYYAKLPVKLDEKTFTEALKKYGKKKN